MPAAMPWARPLRRLAILRQGLLINNPMEVPVIAAGLPPRFESLLVATVKAQRYSEVEMTEGEVRVQLDRAARVRYGGSDVASPMARLGEHILGLWVFTIECYS